MTQKDKELLLKDLCARLPYKVKVQDTYYNELEPAPIWLLDLNAQAVRLFADEGYQNIEYIKPYLFPLSTMNEEQSKELEEIDPEFYSLICENGDICVSMDVRGYDWLNKNHFDYRGLIEKDLAFDATGLKIY